MTTSLFWKFSLLACCLAGYTAAIRAADHVWQQGIWRGVQTTTVSPGEIIYPVGGTAPSTVPGALGVPVTTPGTAATAARVPLVGEDHFYVIDGPVGLRYVARTRQVLTNIIVDAPIDFVVEGRGVFIKGLKPKQAYKLALISTTRLEH